MQRKEHPNVTQRDSLDWQRAIQGINWFHRTDRRGGVVTSGIDNTPFKIAKLHLPARLAGKTVVDICAWDAAISFECGRRHAARVLATDWYCWHKPGFNTARHLLGSRVEDRELRVEDISCERIGGFDVVIFMGVLYHPPDPLGYLRPVRDVCQDLAVIETVVDALDFRTLKWFSTRQNTEQRPFQFLRPQPALLRSHAARGRLPVGRDGRRVLWQPDGVPCAY